MNSDDFEKRLQSQPMRQIPSEWRAQIIRAARGSAASPPAPRRSFLSTFLWPNPQAWAALAGVWIAIAVIQFAASDGAHAAKNITPPSADTMFVLQQQTRLMTELVGQTHPHEANHPKPNTFQPRSDRRTGTKFG